MVLEIETYPSSVMSKDVWKNINYLTQENIKNGSLPYLTTPYPQDTDLVRGSHLGDMRKVLLELNASLIGAKSLEWLFGADAEIVGLELKKGQKTIPFEGNVLRNGTEAKDFQSVYLLDQFTEESKNKLFSPDLDKLLSSIEDNTRQLIKTVAHKIVKNIDEYNRGSTETSLRKQKKENLRNNIENKAIQEQIKDVTAELVSNYDTNQKKIFEHLQNYYLQQLTGFKTFELANEKKEEILKAFKEVSLVETPRLTELLSNSFILADRKTHKEFSKERLFSELDKSEELKVIAPRGKEKHHKMSKDKLRDRDRTLRPQITRGRE